MKYLNKIKNTKGLNSIELVIISIIVIMCVCLLVDFTNIMKKQHAVSTTVNFVARTMATQGGVKTAKPRGYIGEYFKSSNIYNDIKRAMNDAGVEDSDWELNIKTTTGGTEMLTPVTNLDIIDLGNDIEVYLSINYKWKLTAKILPIKLEGSNTAKRVATSTFKIRNSGYNTTVQ